MKSAMVADNPPGQRAPLLTTRTVDRSDGFDRARLAELVDLTFLRSLLCIPSPSGQEDAIADFLVDRMTQLGFRSHRDKVGNVVGMLGEPAARREIVLLGHMDTVPGAIPVREEAGRMYGRGAVDAKGPLATFVLAAARTASKLNNVRVVVIGSVGEEQDGRGARYIASTRRAPDWAIIGEPSGWNGITLGYKGIVSLEYRLEQASGHSAIKQENPTEKAVNYWKRLADYAEAYNEGQPSHFHTLDPSLQAINSASDGLRDTATMQIATRLPPGIEVSELQYQMQAWSHGARLAFGPSDPPFQSDKNSALVRALLRAIRAESGHPRFKLKTGTTDMNIVGPAWGCPMVAYGPGNSSLDHTPNEHIELDEYRQAQDVLTRTLELLATQSS